MIVKIETVTGAFKYAFSLNQVASITASGGFPQVQLAMNNSWDASVTKFTVKINGGQAKLADLLAGMVNEQTELGKVYRRFPHGIIIREESA